MKKPSNKTISIYLFWVLIHSFLWAMARNSGGNKHRFFPFPHEEFSERIKTYPWIQEYGASNYFQVDKVYDMTEFLFYTSAPILIYYAISFWNKTTESNKQWYGLNTTTLFVLTTNGKGSFLGLSFCVWWFVDVYYLIMAIGVSLYLLF